MARSSILILLLLAATGCAGTREIPAPYEAGTEAVAFVTNATKDQVIDAATTALVGSDFTITIANERLGLLQTDYASVAGIEAAFGDSTSGDPALKSLYVRLTVNAESRDDQRLVQIKGTFQRMDGGTAPDRLIGLYWMERMAGEMARATDSEYIPRVSDEIYAKALENANIPGPMTNRSRFGQSAKAVGIVAAVLFAATLLAGVFSPAAAAN